jgi:hypothetical protein
MAGINRLLPHDQLLNVLSSVKNLLPPREFVHIGLTQQCQQSLENTPWFYI